MIIIIILEEKKALLDPIIIMDTTTTTITVVFTENKGVNINAADSEKTLIPAKPTITIELEGKPTRWQQKKHP